MEGFKCGIEIHQQLEGKKLFCNCPAEIRKGNPDFTIVRRLKSSAGESGIKDQAALHEEKKAKFFVYQGYNDINCMVETDEEPPHSINEDAVEAAVQISKFLNAKIVDQVQIMRKIVVDGSNVSGFQRTALVGRDGYVEVDGKKIGVSSICLEEEACQVVERTDEKDVYNLSRLGIPLIEIGTDPDITSPEQAKKVAEKLGMILRSTGKCKRGIGSIRQDVNVSIKDGARTEIKGFQDLKSIPKVIEYEISRQQKLLDKGEKIEPSVRKAEPDFTTSFLRPMPGAQRMYPETDIKPKIIQIKDIKTSELIDDKIKRLQIDYKLSKELASEIAKKDIPLEEYFGKYKLSSQLIANTAIVTPKEIRRKENIEFDVFDFLDEILAKLADKSITADVVPDVMLTLAKGEKVDYANYSTVSDEDLEKGIKEIVEKNKGSPIGALMGEAMKKYRGKAEGKKVMELVKKFANN